MSRAWSAIRTNCVCRIRELQRATSYWCLGRKLRPSCGCPVSAASRSLRPHSGTTVCSHGDRKSVVEGKSVSVRVDLGGRRICQQQKYHTLLTASPTASEYQTRDCANKSVTD